MDFPWDVHLFCTSSAANRNSRGMVSVENSGHGGAGVAASWACASRATDCLVEKLGGKAW